MEGLEPGWSKRLAKGDILVAGKILAAVRQGARPLAILGAGIPVVIGSSFARIFYRNAFNMGLPLLEVEEGIEGYRRRR